MTQPDLRTAAQQALDAILDWRMTDGRNTKRLMPAYYSLRAALAEPPTNQCGETCERAKLCAVCARGLAEPVQEPVAEIVEDEFSRQVVGIGRWLKLPNGTKLYTAPPQRKPLTDEEIAELAQQEQFLLICDGIEELTEIARAIERAHGIGRSMA